MYEQLLNPKFEDIKMPNLKENDLIFKNKQFEITYSCENIIDYNNGSNIEISVRDSDQLSFIFFGNTIDSFSGLIFLSKISKKIKEVYDVFLSLTIAPEFTKLLEKDIITTDQEKVLEVLNKLIPNFEDFYVKIYRLKISLYKHKYAIEKQLFLNYILNESKETKYIIIRTIQEENNLEKISNNKQLLLDKDYNYIVQVLNKSIIDKEVYLHTYILYITKDKHIVIFDSCGSSKKAMSGILSNFDMKSYDYSYKKIQYTDSLCELWSYYTIIILLLKTTEPDKVYSEMLSETGSNKYVKLDAILNNITKFVKENKYKLMANKRQYDSEPKYKEIIKLKKV